MRSRAILDCTFAPVVATLALLVVVPAWAESPAERAERVASLTPAQKESLLRKKQRFDALEEMDKQRLRKLDESLSSAPDAAQLHGLLERYSNWLKALQPLQRSELVSLREDQRIEKIKEIVRVQEGQRFRDFVDYLPAEDQERIYKWLDDFVEEHERKILDALPHDDRRRMRDIEEDRARRKALIIKLGYRRPDSNMPFPSQEEIDQMVTGLSEATRKEIARPAAASERTDRARGLVFAAIGSIAYPPPSEEQLRKFYADLPVERRSQLEGMDSDDMQRALRHMYRMAKFSEHRGGWRGGSPRGGEGPRGRGPGGPPTPDFGQQPPGFASPAPTQKNEN